MTILEKIKETINKLPFNGIVGKIPALAKVASYANYAFCGLVLVILLILVLPIGRTKSSKELAAVEKSIKKELGLTPQELIVLNAIIVNDGKTKGIDDEIYEYELQDDDDKVFILEDTLEDFEDLEDLLNFYDISKKDYRKYTEKAKEYIKDNKDKIKAHVKKHSSKSADVTKLLDKYENLVKEMEKAAKKNNMSSLMKVYEEASKFADEIEDMDIDKWSSKDMARYLKLSERYTEAAEAVVDNMDISDMDLSDLDL
ncbi:MAG: hypothetical protein IKZ86_14300 [Spirochaetaceae bacterium]|nr:hypothetical protein [Spirochaetaceae bacterium]